MSSAPAQRAREVAAESRFVQLCRVGFIGRGLLYILIGILVVGTGRTEDLTGALEYLGQGSGRVLLMAITAGMVAYGIWRLADAVFGIDNPGNDGKAMRKRAAAAVSGVIYLYLAYKALRILLAGDSAESSPQQQADTLLDLPGGAIILGVAALVLIVAGLAQLRSALQCTFLRNLGGDAVGPAVKWLGRAGYAARGIIFLMVGWLIGQAALDTQSSEAGGMEQALDLLSGPLLFAVAGGLVLFGVFSIIQGIYRRIHAPPVDEMKQDVRDTFNR